MGNKDPYPAMANFVAVARPATSPWLVLIGLSAFWVCFWGLPWILYFGGVSLDWLDRMNLGATPWFMFLLLTSFAVPVIALRVVLRRFHGRRLLSLLGDRHAARRHFTRVLLWVGLVLAILTLTYGFDVDYISRVRPFPVWLALAPIGLAATFIQTSAEELLFRGYLQQQLGALSANPLVWMVLPSILFALPHALNTVTMIDAAYYVGWTFLFGLAAADLTARAGNLGPALALHFANNAFQFLLFGYDNGPMSGFALVLYEWDGSPVTYIQPDYPVYSAFLIVGTLLTLFVLWLAARVAIRR